MEKVRPWCGQPSDRKRLQNRTEQWDGASRTNCSVNWSRNICNVCQSCGNRKRSTSTRRQWTYHLSIFISAENDQIELRALLQNGRNPCEISGKKTALLWWQVDHFWRRLAKPLGRFYQALNLCAISHCVSSPILRISSKCVQFGGEL